MRILLIFSLVLAALFGKIQTTPQVTQNQKLFLWEVQKENIKFYLFGTMHLKHPAADLTVKNVKPLIKEVDEVYTEIPLNIFAKFAVLQAMTRDDNKTIKDILPPKLYTDLDNYLRNINPLLNASIFNKYKIMAIVIGLDALKYEMYYPDIKPIDEQIYNYAKSLGKKTGGIELVEEQIKLFELFNPKESIKILKAALDYNKKHPDADIELIKYYLSGDGNSLLKLLNESLDSSGLKEEIKKRYLNALLYERNKKMAKRIIEKVSKNRNKKYLFAFGALHFLGDKSVIYYLKKSSFNVKRVNFEK